MGYYEIYVKKKSAPLHVDFKYKETVNGVKEREKLRNEWKAKGYRDMIEKVMEDGSW